MIGFGSVVRYKDSFFIFLGQDEETTYAAKILDHDLTRELLVLRQRRDRQPHNPINQSTALCFVILNTKEFRDQAAYLHNTDAHLTGKFEKHVNGGLDNQDIEALKSEILDDPAYPPRLREIVTKYFS